MTPRSKAPAPEAATSRSKRAAPDAGPVEEETPVAPQPRVVGRSETQPERSQWEIDGKLYDVRGMDDFGIRAQRRLNSDGREFYQLWNSAEDLTDDQEARMEQLLDRMFFGDEKAPSLIDAPKSLLRKLGPSSRADVVLTFTLAPLQKLLLAAAQTEIPNEEAETSEPTTAS